MFNKRFGWVKPANSLSLSYEDNRLGWRSWRRCVQSRFKLSNLNSPFRGIVTQIKFWWRKTKDKMSSHGLLQCEKVKSIWANDKQDYSGNHEHQARAQWYLVPGPDKQTMFSFLLCIPSDGGLKAEDGLLKSLTSFASWLTVLIQYETRTERRSRDKKRARVTGVSLTKLETQS